MTFTVHGRTHRLLSRLEAGDCGFRGLYNHVHANVWTDQRRKKLWRLIDILIERRMIDHDGRAYFILPAGEDELEALDAQIVPAARVFARAA